MKNLALVCLTLVALAVASAPASAETGSTEPTTIERLIRQEDARRNDLQLGLTRPTPAVLIPPAPRIELVERDGFDWLDAFAGAGVAIVAGVGLLAALLALGVRTPRSA